MASERPKVLAGGIGRAPLVQESVAALILARSARLEREKKEREKKEREKKEREKAQGLTDPSSIKAVPDKPAIPVVQTPTEPNTADVIAQVKAQKERILRVAEENQKWYLQQQKTKPDKPWFMFPRKQDQYSEFVLLTPEMAQVLLDHLWQREEGNRAFKPMLVEAYKRDIENDAWVASDEAIGINFSFEVYNGQHRLRAIVQSGKQQPMYITWNVLDEAKWVVDSGAKRSLSERLMMVVDPKLGTKTSGFCKAVMRGIGTRVRFTDTEIAEFAAKWESLIEWVHNNLPSARAEVQAAIAKAYLWYGPDLVEPFCRRLRDIQFSEEGDPAKSLYVALNRAKQNRINQSLVAYRKTLAALEAMVNRKPLYKLYERDEDIFEWLPGWDLPVRKR